MTSSKRFAIVERMHFVVIGRDGTDEQALERRMAVRPAHIEYADQNKDHILVSGPTLNEAGQMNGSVFIVEFPTRADLDAWLAKEPFVVQGVWHEVTVMPYKVVRFANAKV